MRRAGGTPAVQKKARGPEEHEDRPASQDSGRRLGADRQASQATTMKAAAPNQ